MRNLRKDIVSRSSVGSIQIHGAKTHNLRDVTVCIPKHALVGVAGDGGFAQAFGWTLGVFLLHRRLDGGKVGG